MLGTDSYSACLAAARAALMQRERKHLMNTCKPLMAAVVGAALLAPALSMADAPWIPANNNRGYTNQPEDARSLTHGAQGRSAAGAVAPGVRQESAPLSTSPSTVSGKTREQVRNELLNMSPAERQRLQEVFRGS